MSKMVRLRASLRSMNWAHAQSQLDAAPELASRTDHKGRALVGYAAQDARWAEVSWLLARGAPALHAVHGWLLAGEPAPAPLEAEMLERCAKDFVGATAVGPESFLEAALVGGRRDQATLLASSPWTGDLAGWRKAWFGAVKRFDEGVCDALAMSSESGEWKEWLPDLWVHGLRCGRIQAFDWLARAGLNPSGRDVSGATLLVRATAVNNERAVAWLLGHGADPDAVDSSGNTPLHYAVVHGSEAAARMLIEAGADPERRQGKKGQGASPLRLAKKTGARSQRQVLGVSLERVALNASTCEPAVRSQPSRL